jgi:hypothetical protein
MTAAERGETGERGASAGTTARSVLEETTGRSGEESADGEEEEMID